MFQESRRLVQVKLRCSAARDGEVLQDFYLQRGAKALYLADAVVLRSGFEIGKRGDADLMELEDLVGPTSGDREQFKDSFRHFLAQLFKTWMRFGLVELGDDICDSVADTRNLGERARSYHAV